MHRNATLNDQAGDDNQAAYRRQSDGRGLGQQHDDATCRQPEHRRQPRRTSLHISENQAHGQQERDKSKRVSVAREALNWPSLKEVSIHPVVGGGKQTSPPHDGRGERAVTTECDQGFEHERRSDDPLES